METVSQKLDPYHTMTQLDKKLFNLNKISEIICVHYCLITAQHYKSAVITSAYQLKQSPQQCLTMHHAIVYSALSTEKLFLFNKHSFYWNRMWTVSRVTISVWSAVFWPRHKLTIVLLLIHCPIDDKSVKVSPKIRCSSVSNRYCCHGN